MQFFISGVTHFSNFLRNIGSRIHYYPSMAKAFFFSHQSLKVWPPVIILDWEGSQRNPVLSNTSFYVVYKHSLVSLHHIFTVPLYLFFHAKDIIHIELLLLFLERWTLYSNFENLVPDMYTDGNLMLLWMFSPCAAATCLKVIH